MKNSIIFDLLSKLAPIWVWGKKSRTNSASRFQEMCDFFQKNKRIPMISDSIYPFFDAYRRRYLRGTLPSRYSDKLETIPEWKVFVATKDRKMLRRCMNVHYKTINKLNDFVKKHGHCRIPMDCYFSGFPIGRLANRLREKMLSSKMSWPNEATRIALEDVLGCSLESFCEHLPYPMNNERIKIESAKRIKKFCEEKKRLPHYKSDKTIYKLMRSKMYDYKNRRLTEEEIKILESIPFWKWVVSNRDYRKDPTEQLNILRDRIKNGEVILSKDFSSYDKQYKFVSKMKRHKANGQLSRDIVKLCESLPGWTWEGSRKRRDVET